MSALEGYIMISCFPVRLRLRWRWPGDFEVFVIVTHWSHIEWHFVTVPFVSFRSLDVFGHWICWVSYCSAPLCACISLPFLISCACVWSAGDMRSTPWEGGTSPGLNNFADQRRSALRLMQPLGLTCWSFRKPCGTYLGTGWNPRQSNLAWSAS